MLARVRRAQLDAVRERSAAEERLRIARDVHDLVGHGLSSIAVQSSAARLALDAGQVDTARAALSAVESSSRRAMSEMRHLLGVLRGSDAGGYVPVPGLPELPGLVDRLRGQGVSVTLNIDGLGVVPDSASLAAYRVAQEALTNVVRHAPGSRARVDVRTAGGAVVVVVEDYARRAAPPPEAGAGGHGLIGMRERVTALGGQLSAGPAGDHPGWRVRATIPYGDRDLP
jgi:signal transduction histidine kinase